MDRDKLPLRWRAGQYIRRNPVTAGFVVALIVNAFLGTILINNQIDLRHEVHARIQLQNVVRYQNCERDIRQSNRTTQNLISTYRYLMALKPEEQTTTINVTIRRQLPKTEADARADQPPPYCAKLPPIKGLPRLPRISPLPHRPPGI